jgi:hypothetical protein
MMHDSATHLTEDELHDAADGTDRPAEAGRTARHLMHCAHCRAEVERIRELLALAASLPRAIEPPADLWPDIRSRIRASGAQPPKMSSPRWGSFARNPRWLAAAAVLLIVASSSLTALYLNRGPTDIAGRSDSIASVTGASDIPVRRVSDDYDRLDSELSALLDGQRGKLQPETIEKVERNLAVIDAAIGEIRQALAEDPGNEALHQLLKASYGQKSALVRQVSTS